MSNESYNHNKERVYEIYGIPPRERRKFSIHHIIFRREGGGNNMSNLCPLLIEQHRELHRKVDNMEHYGKDNIPRQRRIQKKKHRRGRRRK